MLNKQEMKKIALAECIKMVGKDFFELYKENCCAGYGMTDSNLFRYSLCVELEESEEWTIGDNTPFDYYVFVLVNPETGEVIRDYKNSILPNQ